MFISVSTSTLNSQKFCGLKQNVCISSLVFRSKKLIIAITQRHSAQGYVQNVYNAKLSKIKSSITTFNTYCLHIYWIWNLCVGR